MFRTGKCLIDSVSLGKYVHLMKKERKLYDEVTVNILRTLLESYLDGKTSFLCNSVSNQLLTNKVFMFHVHYDEKF